MLREVHRQRAAHAVAEEASHVAAHGTAKYEIAREVRAEHFDEVQEAIGDLRRVAAGGRRDRRELRRERIGDRNGPSGLVRSARVANPARDREREMRDGFAGSQPLAHRGEKALRQLLRAVHRDLLRAMR